MTDTFRIVLMFRRQPSDPFQIAMGNRTDDFDAVRSAFLSLMQIAQNIHNGIDAVWITKNGEDLVSWPAREYRERRDSRFTLWWAEQNAIRELAGDERLRWGEARQMWLDRQRQIESAEALEYVEDDEEPVNAWCRSTC